LADAELKDNTKPKPEDGRPKPEDDKSKSEGDIPKPEDSKPLDEQARDILRREPILGNVAESFSAQPAEQPRLRDQAMSAWTAVNGQGYRQAIQASSRIVSRQQCVTRAVDRLTENIGIDQYQQEI